MSKLTIIRASAGSGKTHRLTNFFLDIVLKERLDYFKSILGVTFTNKATGEMKRRILDMLYRYTNSDKPEYSKELLDFFKEDTARIREKSAVLLGKILHEYSWFSVETIDTFFQRVIRAFTRELGIPGNYSIEIDTAPIIKYAVDQLLDNLENNSELINWLLQFSNARISEGKSWDIRYALNEIGGELFREEFTANSPALRAILNDRKKLNAFRDKLYSIKAGFEKKCTETGRIAIQYIEEQGLTTDDFFQKKNGAVKLFARLEKCEIRNSKSELLIHSALVKRLLGVPENWPAADSKRGAEVIKLAVNYLLPLLSDITEFIRKEHVHYFTAEAISKNLYTLGILADLEEKVRQYRLERDVFILSDAPKLLDRIINRNDTPFIYEKMGNRYGHFLIDEFQDTSRLQWSNFKPLISNSLSQGAKCLIVGDVKQSIYRWRNSDWSILADSVNKEYPPEILQDEVLDTNWRSAENIVNFNGKLFKQIELKISEHLKESIGLVSPSSISYIEILKRIYEKIQQNVPENKRSKGTVILRFFSKQLSREQTDYYVEYLVESINSLLEKGYGQNNIAFLVRTKKEGKVLADRLIALNNESKFIQSVDVISDESLFLYSSQAVNLLISALQYLNQKNEVLYKVKLSTLYKAHCEHKNDSTGILELILDDSYLEESNAECPLPPDFTKQIDELASLPLYDLCERLVSVFDLYRHSADVPYIHATLDYIHEYTYSNPPDIKGFLEYWEEEGRIKSVPASESRNAMRILTIHKAKGLEFRAVIIPFCSWDLTQKPNSIFWVRPEKAPFDELPAVPVNFTRALKDSYFEQDYEDEWFKSIIDNLNLLYVAFTRAIDTLIAFPLFSDPGNSETNYNNVGNLLYHCIARTKGEFAANFDIPALMYQIQPETGDVKTEQEVRVRDTLISAYSGKPATDRMYFNSRGFEYFQDTLVVRDKRLRGKVLHEILSGIVTVDELEKAICRAELEGLISVVESISFKEHIAEGMKHSIVKRWFDGSGRVLNEREIILPGDNSRRPDRVVIWPDEAHVIDYKFSSERRQMTYNRQVKMYMKNVAGLENRPVRGFIWYVDINEIEEVEREQYVL